MKKLNLNASAFEKGEVLTRSQLKKILGGDNRSVINEQCLTDEDCPLSRPACRWTSKGTICCDPDEQADPSYSCANA